MGCCARSPRRRELAPDDRLHLGRQQETEQLLDGRGGGGPRHEVHGPTEQLPPARRFEAVGSAPSIAIARTPGMAIDIEAAVTALGSDATWRRQSGASSYSLVSPYSSPSSASRFSSSTVPRPPVLISVTGRTGASAPPSSFQLRIAPVKMPLSWARETPRTRFSSLTNTPSASYPTSAQRSSAFSCAVSSRITPATSTFPARAASSPLFVPRSPIAPNR